MSKSIVISQSMYFPWIGMLEQLKVADVFVHYDDVNFSRGFFNRVQIKTNEGTTWLTVPIHKWHRGDNIDTVKINRDTDWESKHLNLFDEAYRNAPYKNDALEIMENLFSHQFEYLYDLTRRSTLLLGRYFDIIEPTEILDSSELGIDGSSSDRLFKICKKLSATKYITGHGAYNYLDHSMFEAGEIEINYMDYAMKQYPQLHYEFTPYVSALDLVANCGKAGAEYILPRLKSNDF